MLSRSISPTGGRYVCLPAARLLTVSMLTRSKAGMPFNQIAMRKAIAVRSTGISPGLPVAKNCVAMVWKVTGSLAVIRNPGPHPSFSSSVVHVTTLG